MNFKSKLSLLVLVVSVFGAKVSFAQSVADQFPPPIVMESCSGRFDDGASIRCCELGFSGDDFTCCKHQLEQGKDPGTPADPVSCEIIHPEPKPCDDVADPDLKSCCEEHGGLTLEAVMSCIPDQPEPQGDCNIVVNGDVNAPLNICCQIVNNEGGTINGGVLQQCGQTFEPGDEPKPVDPCQENPGLPECQPEPTEPEGDAEGSCVVTAANSEDFVGSKLASITAGGTGVALIIRAVDLVKDPAAYVEIKQVEGPLVVIEGLSEPQAGEQIVKILDTKIGPFQSQPSWIAHMALPKSYIGKFLPDAKFTLSVYDVKGNVLKETTCAQKAFIEAKGGGAGCSLIR